MRSFPPRRFVLVGLPAALLAAAPADGIPPPIQGISFDEWTSANARLARGQDLDGILATLQVSKAAWEEANAGFIKAMQSGPPGGPLMSRYGEVFASPDAGRFRQSVDSPKAAILRSYEDYIRVQAEMAAAGEAGLDPVRVLKEKFDLTPFDYSQEGARWVQAMAQAARTDPPLSERWRREQEAALADARRRYGARKTPGG